MAGAVHKRRRSESLLCDEEPDLHILVHGRSEPLKAHYQVLSLYSGCVRGLPKPTDGSPTLWDVSGLLPEGESAPFNTLAVEGYLDVVYSHVDASRRVTAPSTLDEAKELILFADAAASSPVVFEDLARILCGSEDLRLKVLVGQQLQLDLALRGQMYFLHPSEGLMSVSVPFSSSQVVVPPGGAFMAQVEHIPAAVCAALEEWLYLAGRLRMAGLVRLLLDFLIVQLVPN